jgi:uncharacterized damage-inducible protein DinB
VVTVAWVTASDQKAVFLQHLDAAREGLIWKLDGLSDYDLRRPVTRTGTNLLGIVKHVALVESGYLGSCFGRPVAAPVPVFDPAQVNSDMWATVDESRDFIVGFYQRVAQGSAATVDAVDLDERGTVPHWPEERRHPTLQELLVRMVGETNRHAGHADIVREVIDGSVGVGPAGTKLPAEDEEWWVAYRHHLEEVASSFDPDQPEPVAASVTAGTPPGRATRPCGRPATATPATSPPAADDPSASRDGVPVDAGDHGVARRTGAAVGAGHP